MNFIFKNKKNNFKLLIKHSIISIICAATEFSLFMIFYTNLNFNLRISYLLSFIVAITLGFIGHSFFTFNVNLNWKRNLIFFISQCLISLFLGFTIINLLLTSGWHPSIAKVTQLFITFFFNVIFGKFISFKK